MRHYGIVGAGFMEELAFKPNQNRNCGRGQITGLRKTIIKFLEVRERLTVGHHSKKFGLRGQ